MFRLLIFLFVFLHLNTRAQLPDGSLAPDFMLTDYNGNSHQLYSYLDAGKTVFVEIFAAHCPSCWNYHQTDILKDLYLNHGPNGTDEIMVLALEYDEYNGHNAFIGDGDPWVTQGNWLDGTPYPIFNVENPDRGVFIDYNVTFYPVIYKVCPDRVLERIMTSETANQLHQQAQACNNALNANALQGIEGNIYIDHYTENLMLPFQMKAKSVTVFNTLGESVKTFGNPNLTTMSTADLRSGVYLFRIEFENGVITKKLVVN